jgi:hypothetical protein
MKSLIFLLSLLPVMAHALPVLHLEAVELEEALDRQYDFEGIIKLSNCSGALVTFSGMPSSARALVMTNGHCIDKPGGGFLAPGETWINRNIRRTMWVFDRRKEQHPVEATRILYATMTRTDLAFYELSETFEELEARLEVKPLLLSPKRPMAGLPIEIISGYWERGYACQIDGFVPELRESSWRWFDSIRYTPECDTVGGTSGSPILAAGEKLVVGINNTSNRSGLQCQMNNPCEVDQNGTVTSRRGVRYGQQTYDAYTCLTPDFRFDFKRPGCALPN